MGRKDGVNLYVAGIFHIRSPPFKETPTLWCLQRSLPPFALLLSFTPFNLLHVATPPSLHCAPTIRCNEKRFKIDSHLPCDANWAHTWNGHERGALIPDCWKLLRRRREKKEKETQGGCGGFFFGTLNCTAESKIKSDTAHKQPQTNTVMRGYTIFISCNLRGITTVPPQGSYWSRWAPGERRRSKLEDAVFGLHSCLAAEGWNCWSHFSHQTWEPEKQIESILTTR